jgi:hypothetical protein
VARLSGPGDLGGDSQSPGTWEDLRSRGPGEGIVRPEGSKGRRPGGESTATARRGRRPHASPAPAVPAAPAPGPARAPRWAPRPASSPGRRPRAAALVAGSEGAPRALARAGTCGQRLQPSLRVPRRWRRGPGPPGPRTRGAPSAPAG